jgi:uncharacterized protein DUF3604
MSSRRRLAKIRRTPVVSALVPALVPTLIIVALCTARVKTQEAGRDLQDGARPDVHEEMVADKHATYGPADGAGRLVLIGQPNPPAVAGTRASYVLEYTAGPLGVAKGGALYFQVSPFWGWESPSAGDPVFGGGNTRVTTEAEGVALHCEPAGDPCLQIRIDDAPLPAGAQVRIEYGGARGAKVDDYAESEESFFLWVDGDGDGKRKLVPDEPRFRIAPGRAVDLVVHAPSEVAVGQEFEVALAFLDANLNAAVDFTGEVALAGGGLELPATVPFVAADRARKRVTAKATAEGIRGIVATVGDRSRTSNPILVTASPRRILWADLHGHSSFSDGTGTPEDFYEYARHVAGLDVAVLTDHDHWGLRKLDQSPELWKRIREATERANEPGRFTTLLGFEWTSWLYGHRHVLWFGDADDDARREVISSLDAATQSPEGLWAALRASKARALTFPHHPGGGPVPVDWRVAPDPEFEPVVEITSVHGTSEEPNGPRAIYSARRGHFARDALAKGYRLGFVGSGDSHDGHPGLVHLNSPCGGVAAIVARDDTRDAVYDALKARLCWATTGPRILLWFRLGATRMGGEAAAAEAARPDAPPYSGFAIGESAIARIEIVKNGAVVASADGGGKSEAKLDWHDAKPAAGDYVYLRVIQIDGHAAWSSPIFTR